MEEIREDGFMKRWFANRKKNKKDSEYEQFLTKKKEELLEYIKAL